MSGMSGTWNIKIIGGDGSNEEKAYIIGGNK